MLADWMLSELEDEIEESGVRAGWIKLSAGDDGLTATETKILRAAARAGAKTNAVIGSHTIKGRVVLEQLDIIEAAGYSPTRFISIHTQAEPDFSLHLAIARRGAFVEYDGIGGWGETRAMSRTSTACSTPGSAINCSSARTAAGTTRRYPAAARRSPTRISARFFCRSSRRAGVDRPPSTS